ncbi:MAG: hypothetical protein QOD28_1185, partial [Acidobacteriota bacterium]|nr:hypothetical protein [Acidobacteriota bacterium]
MPRYENRVQLMLALVVGLLLVANLFTLTLVAMTPPDRSVRAPVLFAVFTVTLLVRGVSRVVDPEVALWHPRPAELHHVRALVEPGHAGAAADELRGVQAGPARRVQHVLTGHVAQQAQAGGAVVISVVEPVLGVAREVSGDRVVLGLASHLVHPA